jgi:hypothetical protein
MYAFGPDVLWEQLAYTASVGFAYTASIGPRKLASCILSATQFYFDTENPRISQWIVPNSFQDKSIVTIL